MRQPASLLSHTGRHDAVESRININVSAVDYDKTSSIIRSVLNRLQDIGCIWRTTLS